MNYRRIKDLLIGALAGGILVGGIATASTLVTENVYINPFKILLNGNQYNPVMPILNYSGRTYVPLKELATLTGSEVDFQNDNIIINNAKNKYSDYCGKWWQEDDENSYIEIKNTTNDSLVFDLFFYRLTGLENTVAYLKSNNVFEFNTLTDDNEVLKTEATIKLNRNEIVVNIIKSDFDYIEDNTKFVFKDRNNENKRKIAIQEMKKCLLDNKWVEDNIYIKQNCFGESISLQNQNISFELMNNDYDNMPQIIIQVLEDQYPTEEKKEEAAPWGVTIYLMYYNNGNVVCQTLTKYPAHPAHVTYFVNKEENTAGSIYMHMGYNVIEVYDVYKGFSLIEKLEGDYGDDQNEANFKINGIDVTQDEFEDEFEKITGKIISSELNPTNINNMLK